MNRFRIPSPPVSSHTHQQSPQHQIVLRLAQWKQLLALLTILPQLAQRLKLVSNAASLLRRHEVEDVHVNAIQNLDALPSAKSSSALRDQAALPSCTA